MRDKHDLVVAHVDNLLSLGYAPFGASQAAVA
jgi:hypothetical protein